MYLKTFFFFPANTKMYAFCVVTTCLNFKDAFNPETIQKSTFEHRTQIKAYYSLNYMLFRFLRFYLFLMKQSFNLIKYTVINSAGRDFLSLSEPEIIMCSFIF